MPYAYTADKYAIISLLSAIKSFKIAEIDAVLSVVKRPYIGAYLQTANMQ